MSDNPKTAAEAVEKLNKAFEEFKATNDQRLKEIAETNHVSAETKQKLEKIEQKLDEYGELKKTLERVENRVNHPGFNQGKNDETPQQLEHKEAFFNALRAPFDKKARRMLEEKAVTIASNEGGGYAVPEVISRQIEQKLLDVSPMRQVATVETVSSSDYKKLVDVRGAGAEWLGESDTRNETNTPQLKEVVPTFGMLSAKPQASEESLQDIFFDVQSWLVNSVTEQFAKTEGIAFISGNGTKKPTGMLNGTPVSTGDEDSPARAFGVLQYLPTGVADGFGSLDILSPNFHYPSDVLLTTVYTLKAGYRRNAKWMMNKATAGTIRKFKDSEGNYLWTPGIAAGQPDTLLGYGVVEAEDMPDIGTNAFPVAFGDYKAGYLIVDRVGMRMSIDDNITTPGFVKFYMRKRVGGKLMNDDAIKLIKCAAS